VLINKDLVFTNSFPFRITKTESFLDSIFRVPLSMFKLLFSQEIVPFELKSISVSRSFIRMRTLTSGSSLNKVFVDVEQLKTQKRLSKAK